MRSSKILAAALSLAVLVPSVSQAAVFTRPSAASVTTTAVQPVRDWRGARWAGRPGVYGRPYAYARPYAYGRPYALARPYGYVGRPYWYARPWGYRPYYGSVVAGVALGTLITVAAVGAIPRRPAPDLCWYWVDRYEDRGYWDYC